MNPAALDSAQWVAKLASVERQWARSVGGYPRARLGELDTLDTALPEAFFPNILELAQYDRGTGSLAWARRAVALHPRSTVLQRTLGQVLLIRGDSLLARQAFQQALVVGRTAADSVAARKAAGKLLDAR